MSLREGVNRKKNRQKLYFYRVWWMILCMFRVSSLQVMHIKISKSYIIECFLETVMVLL